MKKFLCIFLSVLILILCVGCYLFKNSAINKWTPLTLPDEIQNDLSAVEGEVIEFKILGYVNRENDFKLISNLRQIETIKAYRSSWQYPWVSSYSTDSVAEVQTYDISELRKIDFSRYYLLLCPIRYAPCDNGFEGEPLIRLLNRDNELYYVIQSDWPGGDFDQAIEYVSALVLVKKSDWTLGEDISSAEVLVYNKNHKDVGACYYSYKSVFK